MASPPRQGRTPHTEQRPYASRPPYPARAVARAVAGAARQGLGVPRSASQSDNLSANVPQIPSHLLDVSSADLREIPLAAYLAPEGFIADLLTELTLRGEPPLAVRHRLVLTAGPVQAAAWAQNVWQSPMWLPIDSIADAARKLKALQRNWHATPTEHHRRTALVQAQLPHVSARPLEYGQSAPTAALGSWTLWESDMMLASPVCASPFADGQVVFCENRTDPPSRAYLKLWEVFTLIGVHPVPGELCVDLGACPGGWSWVLAGHGARVFAIDKAPLAEQVASNPLVDACQGSGFALDPQHAGAVDWVCSDMICYPDRLWTLVERWLEHGACRNMICTLKFQAETDHAIAAKFAAVPGSRLMHLSVNRHELTWVRLQP